MTRKRAAGNRAVKRRRGRNAWLVKTEPGVYSIDDLRRDRRTMWDGVRNYQARNIMRDEMRVGDRVFVYHSNAKPLAVVGEARVASEACPDPTQFDADDDHFDPKATRAAPIWMLVDLEHVATWPAPLERAALGREPALAGMMLLQRGSRLSVQPVSPAEAAAIDRLVARGGAGRRTGASAT